MIPLSAVRVDEAAEGDVLEVLRSGQLAQGPTVERFEKALRDRLGVAHVVAVSSGTAALSVALEALGVGPGAEVVTTPFTFAATVNAILGTGATACLADVDPADMTLDPKVVEAVTTDRTAALLPVHLYGQAADLTAFEALASRTGTRIVEDAAQAFGATFGGTPVGTLGTGCFSFYATKGLTTGEGGAVATADADVDDTLRLLRNQGMRGRYEYEVIGQNVRMTEIGAALGLAELRRFDVLTARRMKNAELLTEGLQGIDGLATPQTREGRSHVFHQYTVRVGPSARVSRDELRQQLTERGVETGVHYPRPLYRYDCYRDHPRVRWEPAPEAERAADEVLSLPVHPFLDAGDLEHIVSAVRSVLDG